ncbi:hypothetical protein PspLS_09031 [Pyricularia sp. CBS 133598]|nr:hypothetical protein PspLS_09031 [Pyricularia sp. CBS 133598]
MPKNADIDVDEVHSIINEVEDWHRPIVPPVEPGWSQPRGGGDEADARTDDSKDTLTAEQGYGYTYSTEPVSEYDDYRSQTTAYRGSQDSSEVGTAPSGYSQSTAPSLVEDTGGEQPQVDGYLAEQEQIRGPLLVCEFRDLCGCPEIFDSNEPEAWIDHISSHLGYRFPAKAICWFCSSQFFDSEADRGGKGTKKTSGRKDEASQKQERRAYAFQQRLEHVAWHIVEGQYRYQDMRPDFDLMTHMHKHGMLDDETYNFATAFMDPHRPPPSHQPEKQRRIKTNPPDWEPPHKILERERRDQVIYDQPKEDRQRKKEAKKAKK